MRSPISWFGGKGHMVKKLLPYCDVPHQIYVEPYGGGASLLFAKRPSPVEVYNDLDGGLVNFFKVLANPDLFARFHRQVALLPYSRQLYYEATEKCQGLEEILKEDKVEWAVAFFVVSRQSFGGRFGAGWGFSLTKSQRGMAMTVSRWLSAINRLLEVYVRLQRVQIEHKDGIEIIKLYDTPETFFYVDPPYPHETRTDTRYQQDSTDHEALLDVLLNVQGYVLLSSYPSELYSARLQDWACEEIQTACYAVGRTRATKLQGKGAALANAPRTECIWANSHLIEAVEKGQHAFAFVGNNGNGHSDLVQLL